VTCSFEVAEKRFDIIQEDRKDSSDLGGFSKIIARSTKLKNDCCDCVAQGARFSILLNSLLNTPSAVGDTPSAVGDTPSAVGDCLLCKNRLRGSTGFNRLAVVLWQPNRSLILKKQRHTINEIRDHLPPVTKGSTKASS
jgi:hypothetical protein